jgi:hypothetical protein
MIHLHFIAFFASMVFLASSVFCPTFPITRQEDYTTSPFKDKYFSPESKKTYG